MIRIVMNGLFRYNVKRRGRLIEARMEKLKRLLKEVEAATDTLTNDYEFKYTIEWKTSIGDAKKAEFVRLFRKYARDEVIASRRTWLESIEEFLSNNASRTETAQ